MTYWMPAVRTERPRREMNTAQAAVPSSRNTAAAMSWPGFRRTSASTRLANTPTAEESRSMTAVSDEQKSMMRRLESWKAWKFPEK